MCYDIKSRCLFLIPLWTSLKFFRDLCGLQARHGELVHVEQPSVSPRERGFAKDHCLHGSEQWFA